MLLGIVRFEQRGQVIAVENRFGSRNVDPPAQQTQNPLRNQSRQPCNGIKQDIEKVDDRCENAVIEIGVVAKNRFRQKLGNEDDNQCRDGRFDRHGTVPCHAFPSGECEQTAQQQRHVKRINDQRDIVADEDSRNILSGPMREDLGDKIEHAALFAVDFQFQPVLARESDLHAGEKGRQEQHRRYDDNRSNHYFSDAD